MPKVSRSTAAAARSLAVCSGCACAAAGQPFQPSGHARLKPQRVRHHQALPKQLDRGGSVSREACEYSLAQLHHDDVRLIAEALEDRQRLGIVLPRQRGIATIAC